MVNPGEFVGGAALGGAFGAAVDVVKETMENILAFDSKLEDVTYTVESLQPLTGVIEGHNTTLGGRQDDVKQLKETLFGGKDLTDKLFDVHNLNPMKALYTGQLVEVDQSIDRELKILQVQGVRDLKENLVLTKENKKVGEETLELTKKNINQLVNVEESIKAGFSDLQKWQEEMVERWMSRHPIIRVPYKVDVWLALLRERFDTLRLYVVDAEKGEADWWAKMRYKEIDRKLTPIRHLFIEKSAENEALLNVPTDEEELKMFIVQIEAGAEAVRSSTKVLEWTEELKSEYTNRFLELNKSLDGIYRLKTMHPLKFPAGKFGKCGKPWSNGFVSINNTMEDSVFIST